MIKKNYWLILTAILALAISAGVMQSCGDATTSTATTIYGAAS